MKKVYFFTGLLLLLLVTPFISWQLKKPTELAIGILDKTVATESYREHLGLNYFLNHSKIVKPDGQAYDLVDDYYGFLPNDEEASYRIRENETNYEAYDILYLADTYGVFEEDLPYSDVEVGSRRTEKIYGGLTETDWASIVQWLNQRSNNLLVAEFNLFASPTNVPLMENVTDFLGVEWDGWTGRYFEELDPNKNPEIPAWMIEQYPGAWDYSGEGFILVNDIEFELIVLEKSVHMDTMSIKLKFTEEGQAEFGLTQSPAYNYWFDIITPAEKADTTVLATYDWDLNEAGVELLTSKGIPTEFAAVVKRQNDFATSYYFAGDYNDVETVPSLYQANGLPSLYKLLERYSNQSFYWSTYFPMMEAIIASYQEEVKVALGQSDAQRWLADEPTYNARINDQTYEVLIDNQWEEITIKGVNIGMGKPGYWPGEAAITEEDYYQWFEQIGEMNANTIRVYTLHPPGFYEALARYNEGQENPLYVMHGAWINEEMLVDSQDAFEPVNLADFQDEMTTLVDVIHGNRFVEAEVGHASGLYTADVSEYVIAWLIGIEWDPFMTLNTNKVNQDLGEYEGKYFETKGAQAFEHWLAMNLDYIVDYELENYNWIRPVSFSNWPTTDLLSHPSDLSEEEDIVTVDPNLVYTKGVADLTGQFASYHVYPYYPDFLNYDEAYQKFVDSRGEFNNYAGYLHDLHEAHRLPILIAEFGIPSSRGITHRSRYGWNQGFMSEIEQGETVSLMYQDILAEEMLGGLIFTWQDEWFKRTWNTMDYDNPDRRPYWSNVQTTEQQFGLLSFDRHKIQIDGDLSEWVNEPFYVNQDGLLKSLSVDHDESYLYLSLEFEPLEGHYPMFLFDVVPDQGNHSLANSAMRFDNGVEFIANLDPEESRLLIDTYYDFYTYLYGTDLKMLDPLPPKPTNNSGDFMPIEYVLSREYASAALDLTIGWETAETGKLKEGNGNPESVDYDSLADYYWSTDGVLELRLPWLLLQSEDPSRHEFTGDIYQDGLEASKFVEGIYLSAVYMNQEGEIVDSFTPLQDNTVSEFQLYAWPEWDLPAYGVRLKQSYYIIQELFED